MHNKKSYLNSDYHTNLILITNNTKRNITVYSEDPNIINEEYFDKILEWNLNYYSEFHDIHLKIKDNILNHFLELKEYYIFKNIKDKVSHNIINIINKKNNNFLLFISNTQKLLEKFIYKLICYFQENIFRFYEEKKLFDNTKNDLINIKIENIFSIFDIIRNSFNDIFVKINDLIEKPFNKAIENSLMIGLNKNNVDLNENADKLINQVKDLYKNNNKSIEKKLFEFLEFNMNMFKNLIIDIESLFNDKFVYDEYLQFISQEEFKFKKNVNEIVEKFYEKNNIKDYNKENSVDDNFSDLFENIFIKIINLGSDFNRNLIKLFDRIEEKEIILFLNDSLNNDKINMDFNINLWKLVLIDEVFQFKDELKKFLIFKNKNINFSNETDLKRSIFHLNNIFYEINFLYDSNMKKSKTDEINIFFNYICEINIYYINNVENKFDDILNKMKIPLSFFSKKDIFLISSKIFNIKNININFNYKVKDDNKDKKKLKFLFFSIIINENFKLDQDSICLFSELYPIKEVSKKSNKIKSISEILNRMKCDEMVVSKSDKGLNMIFNQNRFYKKNDKIHNPKEDSNKKLNKIMFNVNLAEKKIYFGEISKGKYLTKKYASYNKPYFNPDIFDKLKLDELNNSEYNIENNLNRILNKNRKEIKENSSQGLSNFVESDFSREGFGVEIYNYNISNINCLDEYDKNNFKENENLSYLIGNFISNKLEGLGLFHDINYFYFGEYKDSFKNGFAYLYFKLENDIYLGQINNNILKGNGIYLYNDNPVIKFYLGNFVDNNASGKGEIVFKNKDFFKGDFKENQKILNGNYINSKKDLFYVSFTYDKKGNEELDQRKYIY